jgi:hypothetical protein
MDIKDFNCVKGIDICLISELVIYDLGTRSNYKFWEKLELSLASRYRDSKVAKYFKPSHNNQNEGVAMIYFIDKDDLIFRSSQRSFREKMNYIILKKFKESFHKNGIISFEIPSTLYEDSEDTRKYLSMGEERHSLLRNIVLDARFRSHFQNTINASQGLFLFCFLDYIKDQCFIINYIKSLSIEEKISFKRYLVFIMKHCETLSKEDRGRLEKVSFDLMESYKSDSMPYFLEIFEAIKKSQSIFLKDEAEFCIDKHIGYAEILEKKSDRTSYFLKSLITFYKDEETSELLLKIANFCKDSIKDFKDHPVFGGQIEGFMLSTVESIEEIIPIINPNLFLEIEEENIKRWAVNIKTRSSYERLMFYEKIITSGKCNSKIARRIRSDSSENTSYQALEFLFRWRGRYSKSDFNLMLNQFLDTNYHSVCNVFTYGAQYVPEDILLSFIGNKKADNDSIFKKIESQKKK